MNKLTYLQINKYRRLYNDVVTKGLEKLGIKYTEKSTKYGYLIFIDNTADLERAQRFLLSVSLTKPKYI